MKITAPTWHNSARKGDFAKTVLMPGDPKRSKWIAETYLTDARLVNDVRGVQGYTGLYNGRPVSVMASGMGIPTVSIYARELFEAYDVDNIIRIGTAGAISEKLGMMDVVAGTSASTDSNFGAHFGFPFTLAPTASFSLLLKAHQAAEKLGYPLHIGPLYCSDTLYDDDIDYDPIMKKMHVLAAEMESAGLYLEGMRTGRNALCLCTIVENPYTGEEATAEERETALDRMIRIALEMA
ncbi:MAG: purine-nucleoside phosphorylase [Candidatus Faecivicinus sp.]|nr:purine-nucleoside phosphorylase [Candidatus Faecivicinus sp.]